MAEISAGHSTHTTSVAWWRDERKRAIIWQIVVILLLLLAVAFIVNNMIVNLQTLGIPLGFDFLDSTAGFAVSFSLIPVDLNSQHRPPDPDRHAEHAAGLGHRHRVRHASSASWSA